MHLFEYSQAEVLVLAELIVCIINIIQCPVIGSIQFNEVSIIQEGAPISFGVEFHVLELHVQVVDAFLGRIEVATINRAVQLLIGQQDGLNLRRDVNYKVANLAGQLDFLDTLRCCFQLSAELSNVY